MPDMSHWVHPCPDEPQSHPDCFTDGGVRNPTNPDVSLGGFASWVPRPLSNPGEFQASFAVQEWSHGGRATFSPLPGLVQQSSRLELA
eukprot:1278565-Alexandrium_andersonii.AAC.1